MNDFPCMQTIRFLQNIAEMVDWSCDSLKKIADEFFFFSFMSELTNIDYFLNIAFSLLCFINTG